MMKSPIRHTVPGIFIALISSMAALAMPALAGDRPKLVVGIIIDGLDRQYIDLLREQFGDGGFNRLLRDGVVINSADYGTNVDATAAAAMIVTGAAPSTTNVGGSMVYDREALRPVKAMSDPDVMGNFTNDT